MPSRYRIVYPVLYICREVVTGESKCIVSLLNLFKLYFIDQFWSSFPMFVWEICLVSAFNYLFEICLEND